MPQSPAIDRIRSQVINLAADPAFIHHPWYVQHHLTIVEQISLELGSAKFSRPPEVFFC